MAQAGVDPGTLFDTYLALYNDCLRDKPNDMLTGLHVCRGNIKVCPCSTKCMLDFCLIRWRISPMVRLSRKEGTIGLPKDYSPAWTSIAFMYVLRLFTVSLPSVTNRQSARIRLRECRGFRTSQALSPE